MSVTKTSQPSARSTALSRLPGRSYPPVSPNTGVDTSNLSPGAAARYEKWMRSIDDFTAAVRNKAITPPERR